MNKHDIPADAWRRAYESVRLRLQRDRKIYEKPPNFDDDWEMVQSVNGKLRVLDELLKKAKEESR